MRDLHVEGVFAGEPPTDDLGEGLNNIFANMTRMAASIRKRPTPNDAAKARTILLLDDLQILHQQLDLLQKFLLATNLLSELARSAYANKYRSPEPVEGRDEPQSSEHPADEPMASEVAPSPRQPAAQTIVVTCGHCAKQFTAPESLAGKEVACLNCRRPLFVPRASVPAASQRPKAAAPIPAPAASSSSIQIPVACPQCRARFLAQSWLAGRSVNCPSCGQQILVPTERARPRSI